MKQSFKTKQKVYELTEDDLLKMVGDELPDRCINLLLYLRVQDGFLDHGTETTVKVLAEKLRVSRSTINRCLELLTNKGYISIEKTKAQGRIYILK